MTGGHLVDLVNLRLGRVVVGWMRATDPFGPSEIDRVDVRDAACGATATSRVCNPPTPDPSNGPDGPTPRNVANGASLFGQALVVLLVAALVGGLIWLVIRWRRGEGSRSSVDDELDTGDLDESLDEEVGARVIDHETPPARWRRLAAEHRERGEYREAVRCEYRALVGDLARAGYVDEIPGRTSGEERDQVAEIAPRLGEVGRSVTHAFDVAADTFDAAWFDDADVRSDDDERFLRAQQAVLDVVLSGAARRAGAR